MYNWSVQNQIVAFVDSLRPYADQIHADYYHALYSFADQQSHLLTMLGYPPVPDRDPRDMRPPRCARERSVGALSTP